MQEKPAMTAGRYALLLRLSAPVELQVGSLGPMSFPAGRYLYSGSALRGLEARLARHADGRKVVHWHIDRLTGRGECAIEGAVVLPPTGPDECAMVAEALGVEGARLLHPRFGASDHACPGHLVHLGTEAGVVDAVREALLSSCEGARWLDVAVFRDRGAVNRRRR